MEKRLVMGNKIINPKDESEQYEVVEFKEGKCTIIYATINIADDKMVESYGFSMEDLTAFMIDKKLTNTIIYITSIMVDKLHRRKEIGSEALGEFIKSYGDDVIIVAEAGALLDEYPEMPSDEMMDDILSNLSRFFTANNFVNVNADLAEYETKETYILNNKIGKEVICLLSQTKYRMYWIEEQDRWVYLDQYQVFDSTGIEEGWVEYVIKVDKEGVIIYDTFKRDNMGNKFTECYDVELWDIRH